MRRIDYLVTGALGQLGRAVLAEAQRRGRHAVGVDVQEMPLESRAAVHAVVAGQRPGAVVHCGAITNVDGCEQEPLLAHRINGLATGWVAEAAAAAGAALVYVSTDFVFDGAQPGVPIAVDAPLRPLSVYGASKALGEVAVLAHGRPDFWVVRTSWVFGPGGRNFPRAILDRARSGQPLAVVTDQVGRPTMTHDLAEALLDVADLRPPGGIYHAANEGSCSWHQFAVDVLRESGLGHVAVAPQLAADLKRPAARPAWSVLDTSALAAVRGRPLPHYQDALRRHLQLDDGAAAPPPPTNGPLRGKEYT
ncbi:MAG: dTDP-4-dehydrorhamnose reductase [Planctomycetes bacterium]|nr:dTDP-4-dehydrorhamnose reductase [Planctomycetota bacterium]